MFSNQQAIRRYTFSSSPALMNEVRRVSKETGVPISRMVRDGLQRQMAVLQKAVKKP